MWLILSHFTSARIRPLTTGADRGAAFTGGDGDDEFTGTQATLSALDNLVGGDGTDSLMLSDVSNTAFALDTTLYTISGIEDLTLTHTSDAQTDTVTLDVSGVSGLTSITVTNTGTDIGAAAGGVNIDTKANVTSVTVSGGATAQDINDVNIADTGTAATDKLATVTLTGLSNGGAIGQAIASDALTTLNLNAVLGVVTNTDSAATDSRALTVNYAGGTNGGVTDAGATTATVDITGATTAAGTNTFAAATVFNLDVSTALTAGTFVVAAAKDVNVTLDAKVTASTLTAAAATTLDFTGTAAATVTQDVADTAVITNGGSGALTLTTHIELGQKFVGGSGVDTVTFDGAATTASTLGGGNDVATFEAVAGTGGSVDAGDGTADTVVLTAALAVTLSADASFEADIANFERVQLGAYAASTSTVAAADNNAIALANLDDIAYVVSAGSGAAAAAQVYTISGFKSGGTYVQTGAHTDANVTQALTGSFTGASDSFTLGVSAADGFVNTGVLTLDAVETLTITLDDTDDVTAASAVVDLNLDATSATSITVSGDIGITFANSSYTALRTLDASGVTLTGAYGGVTFTANAALDTTATGGAGNDALTGNTGNDTLVGNAGTDALVGAAGADSITGGEGKDTITGGLGLDTIILTETTSVADSVILIATATATAAGADTITGFTSGKDTLTVDGTAVTATIGTQIAAGADANTTIANITSAANTDGPVYYINNANGLTLTQIETAVTAGGAATGETFFLVDNGTNTLVYFDAAAETDAGSGAGMILLATLLGVTGTTAMVTGDLLVT